MENKSFTTPSGRVLVLKQLLTGRDMEYIEQPMMAIKLAISDKGKIGGELQAGDSKRESVHRAIATVVLSVDGKSEGVLDIVLDMPVSDYRAVVGEVDKIVSGEDFTKPVTTP
jgi:hypothetical protein